MSDPRAWCREVLDRSHSSFALAFRLLPGDQRDAMTAVYAFCRQVDDAVDEQGDPTAAARAMREWRGWLAEVFAGRPGDPLGHALAWAIARFGVRRQHLELILDGVEQDLTLRRLERFEELYQYCYRVASAVGLLCVTITGRPGAECALYAELTGIAVQLTNVLRDVAEDATRDRLYLPLQDLRAFDLTDTEVLSGRGGERLRRLLRFEARRAHGFYRMAAAALPPGERHRLFFAEILRETYQRLLRRIEQADFAEGASRVRLGTLEKLSIALRRRLHPATFVAALGGAGSPPRRVAP